MSIIQSIHCLHCSGSGATLLLISVRPCLHEGRVTLLDGSILATNMDSPGYNPTHLNGGYLLTLQEGLSFQEGYLPPCKQRLSQYNALSFN